MGSLPSLNNVQLQVVRALFDKGWKMTELARILRVSRSVIYKAVRGLDPYHYGEMVTRKTPKQTVLEYVDLFQKLIQQEKSNKKVACLMYQSTGTKFSPQLVGFWRKKFDEA